MLNKKLLASFDELMLHDQANDVEVLTENSTLLAIKGGARCRCQGCGTMSCCKQGNTTEVPIEVPIGPIG